jgi:hypothetical protein
MVSVVTTASWKLFQILKWVDNLFNWAVLGTARGVDPWIGDMFHCLVGLTAFGFLEFRRKWNCAQP